MSECVQGRWATAVRRVTKGVGNHMPRQQRCRGVLQPSFSPYPHPPLPPCPATCPLRPPPPTCHAAPLPIPARHPALYAPHATLPRSITQPRPHPAPCLVAQPASPCHPPAAALPLPGPPSSLHTWNCAGSNSHCLVRSRAGTSTPLGMKQEAESRAICFRGRWMPSKMLPMMPGPSSTDRGCKRERGVWGETRGGKGKGKGNGKGKVRIRAARWLGEYCREPRTACGLG